MSTDAQPAPPVEMPKTEEASKEVATETPKETLVETPAPVEKTYNIFTKENTYTAKALSIAWTENADFILLMNGDVTKHIIVAANVIAVTEA